MAAMPSGWWRWALVVVVLVGTTAWAAPSQLELTSLETQQAMTRLNRDLDASVEKLNQTTRELLDRVNDTDGQAKRLQDIIEGNQGQIETIERSLTELRSALFTHFKITNTVEMWSGPAVAAPEVRIEPPMIDIEPPDGDVAPISSGPPVPEVLTETAVADPSAARSEAPEATAPTTYGDPEVVFQKGVSAYSASDFALAYDYFREYTEQFPQGEKLDQASWRMGTCLLKQAKYEPAIAAFEDVRERFPNSDRVPYAMHNQAEAHAALGQIGKARELLEAVVQQYPLTAPAVLARKNLKKMPEN